MVFGAHDYCDKALIGRNELERVGYEGRTKFELLYRVECYTFHCNYILMTLEIKFRFCTYCVMKSVLCSSQRTINAHEFYLTLQNLIVN